jgi:AcrR family transcriptional regulator
MIELCAAQGYRAVSIAQVSSGAGVSSATFYEQFDSKEDCLLAAYHVAAERVFGQMHPVEPRRAWSREEWAGEVRSALGRLLDALERAPDAGRVLYIEALGAGADVQAQRSRTLSEFEARTQALLETAPSSVGVLDLPPPAVIGATRSIISRRLRTHAEQELPALAGDLVTWLESYAKRGRRARWSTGSRALSKAAPSRVRVLEPEAPERLPRGRHRLPPGVVARSRRTRIIHATAEVMLTKGYEDATVADIVAAAGVSRDVFYAHFTDKQHAFLEAQQHSTQDILDAVAVAYFSAQAWPERVWRGLEMLLDLISAHPALAHLRLVECYAAGPEAVRRAEEITRAFTLFLEEGYNYRPEAARLPRLVSQAITGAIFEVVQRHAAEGDIESLPRELPRLTYIAVAPFTGAEKAIEVVEAIRRTAR